MNNNTNNVTVNELKATAKALGLKGYSKLNKSELMELINNAQSSKPEEAKKSIYEHKTTPADGQGLVSVVYASYLACSIRLISESQLDRIIELMGTINSFEEFTACRELKKLLKKVPRVFQVRHREAGIKGTFVMFPLELVNATKDIHVVITAGLSKYAGNWGGADIEICAYLKKKSEWVNLNVQFINSLVEYENPNFLLPIVKYWHEYAMKSLVDNATKLRFHGLVSSFGQEQAEDELRLATMLRNCSSLANERYAVELAKKQYEKFYRELKCGRLPVEGRYTYMVTDPAYIIKQAFGVELDMELKAGEYWMNGKNCKAGLFRSPLIAPFEAQKVDLVWNEFYDEFYADMVIFNGYDGIWELMGGADFDGDTCACIPADTTMGAIIVNAIKEFDYYVLHEGRSAKEVVFNEDTFWHDLAQFNAIVAKADRTGLITNYATKALEVWHHLKGVSYYAKRNGCTGLYLRHPFEMKRDVDGSIINEAPHVEIINGERLFVIRGLVKNTPKTNFKWIEEYPCGRYSYEAIEELMVKFMLKVMYLSPVQGDEIDGAKTGFYPELFDAIEIAYQSIQTSDRNKLVGKVVSKQAMKNSYWSYSPLAIVHDYAQKCEKEFFERLNDSTSDKVSLVKNLLDENETKMLNMSVNVGGSIMTLIDYLKDRKVEFSKKVIAIKLDNALTGEEKIAKLIALKEGCDLLENGEVRHIKGEKEILCDLANTLNISVEVMAVACYVAVNEMEKSSLSYGWMLFNELISVFARENSQMTLYRVPNYTSEVSISKGNLYINGKSFASVDAEDCEFVPVQNINGRLYALIKKTSVKNRNVGTVSQKEYNTGVLKGFKYNGLTVQSFKNAVVANGRKFDVRYNNSGDLCIYISGKEMARIYTTGIESRNINELVGHTVAMTASPKYEETAGAIKNLVVTVEA